MQQISWFQGLKFPASQFWRRLLIGGLAIVLMSCSSLAIAPSSPTPVASSETTPPIHSITGNSANSAIDPAGKTPAMGTSIPFQVLRVGSSPLSQSMNPKPQVLVFQNQQDWAKFWSRSSSLDLNLQKRAAPTIDFSRQQVIGLSTGSQVTGGFSIQIDRIEQLATSQGEEWVIHYTEKAPGSDCLVTQSSTTPTIFVLTEPTHTRIRLQGKTVNYSCNH
ncbi:MAG TPA: protease complex subunit PrcB family protein [Allocoleopsis sp.]